MSVLHIKLFTSFWNHRKTAKFRSLIGNDALWIMPKLWCYAADNQPDGNFSTYTPEEIAMLIGYQGDAQAMLQAMLQACFIEKDYRLHDWEEHNGYHHSYAERARKAAKARWDKEESTKEEERIGEDRIGDKHCSKHATSNARASNKRKVITDSEFIDSLKAIPAYAGINVASELLKMDAWLLANPGRQKSRKFIVNWLNRCEKPLAKAESKKPHSIADHIAHLAKEEL